MKCTTNTRTPWRQQRQDGFEVLKTHSGNEFLRNSPMGEKAVSFKTSEGKLDQTQFFRHANKMSLYPF